MYGYVFLRNFNNAVTRLERKARQMTVFNKNGYRVFRNSFLFYSVVDTIDDSTTITDVWYLVRFYDF